MKPKPSKVDNKNKKKKKSLIDFKWVGIITILAFLISLGFSFISQSIIPNVNVIISLIVVLVIILIGIIFDMVGMAVQVADIKVFNAMAAKKVKGAKMALIMIKNARKLSTICNDVIGDICGIISGSGGAAIAAMLVIELGVDAIIPTLIISSVIAALTIGGKALGKGVAAVKANLIVEIFAKILSIFSR
jgi:CBS domain containing-hemolysin-like protein